MKARLKETKECSEECLNEDAKKKIKKGHIMYIEGGVAWITTGINSTGNTCDSIVLNGDLIETIAKDYCCHIASVQ